jgi:hypothetical protein
MRGVAPLPGVDDIVKAHPKAAPESVRGAVERLTSLGLVKRVYVYDPSQVYEEIPGGPEKELLTSENVHLGSHGYLITKFGQDTINEFWPERAKRAATAAVTNLLSADGVKGFFGGLLASALFWAASCVGLPTGHTRPGNGADPSAAKALAPDGATPSATRP